MDNRTAQVRDIQAHPCARWRHLTAAAHQQPSSESLPESSRLACQFDLDADAPEEWGDPSWDSFCSMSKAELVRLHIAPASYIKSYSRATSPGSAES